MSIIKKFKRKNGVKKKSLLFQISLRNKNVKIDHQIILASNLINKTFLWKKFKNYPVI